MRLALVDTENTSTDARTCENIETGVLIVEVRDDILEIVEEHSWYNECSIDIPLDVRDLTGINDIDVMDERLDIDHLNHLLSDVDMVVAHNAQYDRTILERYGLNKDLTWACTMRMIDWSYQLIGSRALGNIAWDLRITKRRAHRALTDCYIMLDVLNSQSKYVHRRKHEYFWKELIAKADEAWYVITSPPGSHYDDLRDIGYTWSKIKKVMYKLIPRSSMAEEVQSLRCLNLLDTYSFQVDPTTQFEYVTGLQAPRTAIIPGRIMAPIK